MLTGALLRRAVVALLLAVPLVATGGTADAAACSTSSGVSVVVQFPDNHTETGCAPGDPATGTAALTSAGFSVTYVNGQAFVCRIKGAPTTAACDHTPPANAYWAYFHAKRGGTWGYSSLGAGSYNPAPGSVEGWRFGDGAKPSTAPPPALATPRPSPKPKPTPAPKPSTPQASTGAPSATASAHAGGKAPATPAAQAKARAKARAATVKAKAKAKASASASASGEPTAATTEDPTDSPSGDATGSAATLATSRETSPGSGGGNVPWLWGLIGLVVVGGAAGAVTLVRRH